MKHPVRRPATRERKVGEVVFLAEKLDTARQLSSCCVGTEALLEADSRPARKRGQKPLSRD